MIVMPNNPAIVNTKFATKVVSTIATKITGSEVCHDFKGFDPKDMYAPDFITMDEDGDIHLFYTVISHIDPEEDIEEIADGFVSKKACKKMTKEFVKRYDDELPEGSYVYVEMMFLIVEGESLSSGKARGCTIYERKVKRKVEE